MRKVIGFRQGFSGAYLAILTSLVFGLPLVATAAEPSVRTSQQIRIRPAHFPIGFWPTGTPEKLTERMIDDWAEAGITLTYVQQSPEHMNQVLDWCHKKGIQVIVCDGRTDIYDPVSLDFLHPDDYEKKIASVIADYGSHPAVFGFRIADEPGPKNFRPAFAAAAMMNKVAPKTHAIINFFPWYDGEDKYYDYDSVTDFFQKDFLPCYLKADLHILSYDCYFQMNPGEPGTGYELYFGSLYRYGQFAREHGRDLWVIILSTPSLLYKIPSEAAIRWQFNSSVAYGANGIFYYTFYTPTSESYYAGPIDVFGKLTEKYDWVRHTNKRFLETYGDLFLKLTLKKVTQAGRVYGPVPRFEPDDLIIGVEPSWWLYGKVPDMTDHPFIVSRFEGPGQKEYVMVVNNSVENAVFAKVVFAKPKLKLYRYEFLKGPVEIKPTPRAESAHCDVGVWLAPGEEALFRMEDLPSDPNIQ